MSANVAAGATAEKFRIRKSKGRKGRKKRSETESGEMLEEKLERVRESATLFPPFASRRPLALRARGSPFGSAAFGKTLQNGKYARVSLDKMGNSAHLQGNTFLAEEGKMLQSPTV
jgi:hypothetical protein